MVGIARKNENSAAARLSAPSSIAATCWRRNVNAGNYREALREADPQVGEQGKFRGVVFVRIVVDLVDPKQDGAADDQREADHPRIEQNFLDVFAAINPMITAGKTPPTCR